ncbi:unnamed protein product [Blepharisma stoltei]|uniref:CSC1-like protein n=1 Tax=Blepharisma stoltei TaxID=1481888 RepID=A0AAU9IYL3_9CILI|nr:unnamed protein product [Blepharisma stoltei]
MDPILSGLISAFGFNILIFCILFALFLVYKRFRSKHITSRNPKIIPKNAIFSESDTPLETLFINVWNTSLQDIYERCGGEAYLYLTLLWKIIQILLLMCIIGVIVLVPIYAQGNKVHKDGIEKSGIANILDSPNYMVAAVIYFIPFSIFGYYLAYRVLKEVTTKAQQSKIQLFNYVLEISDLPKNKSCEFIRTMVNNLLQDEFWNNIISIYVVPNLAKLYRCQNKLEDAKEKVEHYVLYGETHSHITKKIKWLEKIIGTQSHYEKLVEKYRKKYEDLLTKEPTGNSGFCYVTFRTTKSAENARIWLNNNVKGKEWIIKTAPSPHEIKWENLDQDYKEMRTKRWLLLVFFCAMFFVVLTPVAFLYFVNHLFPDFKGREFIEGIIGKYFPVLVLIFYQAVVLYYTTIYIVQKERRTNTARETASRLLKYLLFMGVYVFFLQAMGAQTIADLTVNGSWDNWQTELPKAIANTGGFFTIYLLSRAFIVNGFDLFQPFLVVKTKIKLNIASTEKEKILAQEAPTFNFSYEYASMLNAFLIIFTYSIYFPLIIFFGLIYFSMRFCVHKYLILCVHYVDKNSSGKNIPEICLKSILGSVFIFQMTTSLVFCINKYGGIEAMGFIYFVLSIIFYIFIQIKSVRVLNKVLSFVMVEEDMNAVEEPLIASNENLYEHPLEKKIINNYNL